MTRPPAIEKRTSSGGVLFRLVNDEIEVVLILVQKKNAWCLPKGLINKGESLPVAALREVREETGLTGKILDKIGFISYWYYVKDEKVKIRKGVHFYLLQFVGGTTDDHDHEVDEARWFPIDEAITVLSYKSEQEIMQKAKTLIRDYYNERDQKEGIDRGNRGSLK